MGANHSQCVEPRSNLKLYLKRFDSEEIEVLKKIYKELAARSRTFGIDKETFLQYFPLPGLWGERLFQKFCFKQNFSVDYDEFIIGIALCCRGTKQDRIKVLFEVFDLNNDGYLQKSELVAMLSNLPDVMSYILPDGENSQYDTSSTITSQNPIVDTPPSPLTNSHTHLTSDYTDGNGNPVDSIAPVLTNTETPYIPSDSEDETDSEDDPSDIQDYDGQLSATPNIITHTHKVQRPSKVLLRAQKVKQLELKNKNPSALAQSLIDREMEQEQNETQDHLETLVDKIIEECEFVEHGQLSLLEFKAWIEKHDALLDMFTKCLHEEIWGLHGNTLLGTIARSNNPHIHSYRYTRPNFIYPRSHNAEKSRKLFKSVLFKSPTRDIGKVSSVNIKPENFLKIKKLFSPSTCHGFPSESNRASLEIKTDPAAYRKLHNEVCYSCPKCLTPFLMCKYCHQRPPILSLRNGQILLECTECLDGKPASFKQCWNCHWLFQNSLDMIDESEPTKDGVLYKLGKRLHIWVARYFVLIDNVLYYFNKKDDLKPKGFLFLEGCYVEQIKNGPGISKAGFSINHISDHVPQRLLYADSLEECSDWIHSLRTSMKQQSFEHLYLIKEQIGHGKFSVVYKGIHKETGVAYAIKVIEKRKASDRDKELLRSEMAILRLLRFPNVIYFKEVFDTKDRLYIAMELVKGGELYNLLLAKKRLTELHTNRIITQLIQTVAYLHKCGIMHRDIKPENILLIDTTEDSAIKLTDFGLSTLCGPNQSLFEACGTLAYVAPEVIMNTGYNHKADIWSIGVVMYLLLRGKLPFSMPKAHTQTRLQNHYKVNFNDKIWEGISDSAKDLICKMLEPHARRRIMADEALEHIWIKNPTAVISDSEEKYFSEDEGNNPDYLSSIAAQPYPAFNESTFVVSSIANKVAQAGLMFPVEITKES